jgi:hypothetical protein
VPREAGREWRWLEFVRCAGKFPEGFEQKKSRFPLDPDEHKRPAPPWQIPSKQISIAAQCPFRESGIEQDPRSPQLKRFIMHIRSRYEKEYLSGFRESGR